MSSGFPTRFDKIRAVQPPKMARSLKFRIKEVEGLKYVYSENKGADHRAADLRLCFRICKYQVFSRRSSFYALCLKYNLSLSRNVTIQHWGKMTKTVSPDVRLHGPNRQQPKSPNPSCRYWSITNGKGM